MNLAQAEPFDETETEVCGWCGHDIYEKCHEGNCGCICSVCGSWKTAEWHAEMHLKDP